VVRIRTLPDVDVLGAEFDQSVDDLSLVFGRLADQVEMDRVLRGLRFRDREEDQDEASAVGWQYADLVVGLVVDLPTQGARPEPGKTNGVVCVEAEVGEPRSHHRPPALPTRTEARSRPSALRTDVAGGAG
jgi:hypothetical protein